MIGFKFSCILGLSAAILLFCRSGVQCETPCLTGDFDEQLQHILRSQMYFESPAAVITSPVLADVLATLKKRWQDFELIPFGSATIGLATNTSDVDLSFQLHNLNSSAVSYVMQEVKELFSSQPGLYSDLKIIASTRNPRLTFYYIPTQREVDLLFKYGHGAVQDSKLLNYYFNLDERYLPLVRFLKLWFKIHGSTGHESGTLPSYAICLMIIFYLQQKNMAPLGYELQVDAKSYYFKTWDLGFNALPYRSSNDETFHQLLGGFFKYYSEFNFKEYIVSPYTGRPISRNAFKDIKKFPKEYTLNNSTLERLTTIKNILSVNNPMCIQDVFEHDSNEGNRVSQEYVKKYKSLFKEMARMFKDLPSDRILRAILDTDERKETIVNHNNFVCK